MNRQTSILNERNVSTANFRAYWEVVNRGTQNPPTRVLNLWLVNVTYLQAKNLSLDLFSTVPLISQSLHWELIISLVNKYSLHVTFKKQPSGFIYIWSEPLAAVPTNFYKITSLSFLSLSLQCLIEDFVQGACWGYPFSEWFVLSVYTCPYKCIKHLSYC